MWHGPITHQMLATKYLAVRYAVANNTLRWGHNGLDNVSNHQPHHCFLNRLFRRRSKKTSNLRVTGLCVGNSPGTGEFPSQMASNAENVSIWWRHHDMSSPYDDTTVIVEWFGLLEPRESWAITSYIELPQHVCSEKSCLLPLANLNGSKSQITWRGQRLLGSHKNRHSVCQLIEPDTISYWFINFVQIHIHIYINTLWHEVHGNS